MSKLLITPGQRVDLISRSGNLDKLIETVVVHNAKVLSVESADSTVTVTIAAPAAAGNKIKLASTNSSLDLQLIDQ